MSDDERVISWFEENYKGLIVGVIIGLSTLFLYKSYISNQNISQLELSREFDIAVQSYQEGNNAKILEFSELNMEKNPDNIYTSLANLYSAKLMYAEDKINSTMAKPTSKAMSEDRPIQTLKELEYDAIVAGLERTNWNMTTTSQQLGISRMTLYRKLEQHGLRKKD